MPLVTRATPQMLAASRHSECNLGWRDATGPLCLVLTKKGRQLFPFAVRQDGLTIH
jgi:hypothetical protein